MTKESSDWISISDMMAGVMMIFLLITVSYMYITDIDKKQLQEKNEKLKEANQKINKIAETYTDLQLNLNKRLRAEFSTDLKKWDAEIDDENNIRFKEPDIYFDAGTSDVKERFKIILNDFFPRYIQILSRPEFKSYLDEIRIEGHTSNEWSEASDLNERYINNVQLSQQRALRVLEYCFEDTNISQPMKPWLIDVLRANGVSFAKPLPDANASRRVEFKAVVKTKDKILEILDISKTLQK